MFQSKNAKAATENAVQANLMSPVVGIQAEVVVSLDSVGQLAESTGQIVVSDATVVSEIIEINVVASPLALCHVVRQHAVYAVHTCLHFTK